MITPEGRYAMLDGPLLPDDAPDGSLLVFGSEPDVAEMARRVRVGARDIDRRRQRRKMQRASRRKNR